MPDEKPGAQADNKPVPRTKVERIYPPERPKRTRAVKTKEPTWPSEEDYDGIP